jgi:hypothetical protein
VYGAKFVTVAEKEPVVPSQTTLLSFGVGDEKVLAVSAFQQIPRVVIVAPPSAVTLPPKIAEFIVTDLAESVETVGAEGGVTGAGSGEPPDLLQLIVASRRNAVKNRKIGFIVDKDKYQTVKKKQASNATNHRQR